VNVGPEPDVGLKISRISQVPVKLMQHVPNGECPWHTTIDGPKSKRFARRYLALPGEPVICASKAATAVRKLSGMTLV
jgi:hypothetical protein